MITASPLAPKRSTGMGAIGAPADTRAWLIAEAKELDPVSLAQAGHQPALKGHKLLAIPQANFLPAEYGICLSGEVEKVGMAPACRIPLQVRNAWRLGSVAVGTVSWVYPGPRTSIVERALRLSGLFVWVCVPGRAVRKRGQDRPKATRPGSLDTGGHPAQVVSGAPERLGACDVSSSCDPSPISRGRRNVGGRTRGVFNVPDTRSQKRALPVTEVRTPAVASELERNQRPTDGSDPRCGSVQLRQCARKHGSCIWRPQPASCVQLSNFLLAPHYLGEMGKMLPPTSEASSG